MIGSRTTNGSLKKEEIIGGASGAGSQTLNYH